MDLSVCIPILNAKEYLRDCLDSIDKFAPKLSYEIIVVDNASTDGLVAMLAEAYPQVKVTVNPKNVGFAKSLNQALRKAQGDYLLALNPDTLWTEDVATPLLTYMRANPQVGITIPKILNRDGSFQRQSRRGEATPLEVFGYFFGLDQLFPKSHVLNGYLQAWLPEDEIAEVKAVSGSCMFIRRETWQQVGDFDERFFAYQEDSDYCLRAQEQGWLVMYVPLTSIIHFGGEGGSQTRPYHSIFQWHYSYFLYYRKHFAAQNFFLFNWFYYLLMAGKLVFALLANTIKQASKHKSK